MTHPDHETRVGAHSILSMVLMPTVLSPWLDQKIKLSEDVSGHLVSAMQDVGYGRFSSQDKSRGNAVTVDGEMADKESQMSDVYMKQSGQSYGFNGALVGIKTV